MEIELTQLVQMPYSRGRDMEDGIENLEEISVGMPVAEASELEVEIEIPEEISAEERKKRILARLNQLIAQRRKDGKPPSNEEKKLFEEAKREGLIPVRGRAGPTTAKSTLEGRFAELADTYANSELDGIAQLIKHAIENNQLNEDLGRRISEQLERREGLGQVDADLLARFRRDLNSAITGETLPEDDKSRVERMSIQERIIEAKNKKKEHGANPRSMQDLAITIINDEGDDKWGPTGVFPLVNEDNSVNQENFVRWARERMMYHHKNNPRDLELRLGNVVGVDNDFGSTISVFTMDKNRGAYFYDEASGKVLDALADQLKNEIFLFGNMRQYNLVYQEYMSSDSELPKFLAQVHNKEELTDGNNLKTMLTLPSNYIDYNGEIFKLEKQKNEGIITEGEFEKKKAEIEKPDTKIGDALRKSYEIYFFASDFDELQKVLGSNSIYFKKEGMENAFRIIEKKARGDEISDNAKAIVAKIFPGGVLNKGEFISAMNPFNEKHKQSILTELSREMTRQAVAEKYGLEYGLDKKFTPGVNEKGKEIPSERDYMRGDLEYAEAFAWVLCRFTGAAAINDTGAIGFDALTKAMKFRDYRVRQASETRAGLFGNEYDLPVFRTIITDLFNGVIVEKREGDKGNITPFELFRKLDEIEDNPNYTPEQKKAMKEEVSDRFKFDQFTQKGYAGDHLGKGWEIYHSTMGAEEMKLEEIVKWDPFRGVILDRGKFEEQVKEKFLKPVRYAFATYDKLDFGKMTKIQRGVERDGKTPRYVDVTVAERTFGSVVTNGLKDEMIDTWKESIAKKNKEKWTPFEQRIMKGDKFSKEERYEMWKEYVSGPGRAQLWKRAAMAKMAAHIKSHRQFGNGYAPFTEGMVETFYDALKTIKAVDLVGDDENSEEVEYTKRFLTDKDIKWIRKMSGTTRGRMFLFDTVLKSGGTGLVKGAWEGASEFVSGIFK